jgi:hypothetical protein
MLAEHAGDLPPPVDPAQLDPPACHEAEPQDQRRVLGRQRAVRLHAAAKLLVAPLNRVRPYPLPLRLGEAEEREELVTPFPQTRHHARAAFGPHALEGCVGNTGRVRIGRVNDAMEVVSNLHQRVLRRPERPANGFTLLLTVGFVPDSLDRLPEVVVESLVGIAVLDHDGGDPHGVLGGKSVANRARSPRLRGHTLRRELLAELVDHPVATDEGL